MLECVDSLLFVGLASWNEKIEVCEALASAGDLGLEDSDGIGSARH